MKTVKLFWFYLKQFSFWQMFLLAILFLATAVRLFLFFGVEKSLWLDEAALALNILDKNFLELFKPLQYAQSAPPLFLVLTKALVSVFGAGERVLRFIPFLCSILSLFAFWLLAKELFKKNSFLCAISLLIFSLSMPLLYNTIEFKPYAADVLFTILTAYIWLKYLSFEISLKKEICFGVLLLVFPLFSFGSVFPLFAVLILSLFKKRIIFVSLLTLGLIIEYLFVFSKISMGTKVYEYWIPYFINYNLDKILFIFSEIIKYLFYPSVFVLFGFILFITGCVYLFKRNKKAFGFFGLTILGGFLASFFNFYPLYERLSLFLYPILLIIVLYPLYCVLNGKTGIKKVLIYLVSWIIIFSSIGYNFSDKNIYKREEIKPLLFAVQKKFKQGDGIFVFKGAHLTYKYYTKTAFKDTLGDLANDSFVCPYNMTAETCANKIKPFCGTARNRGNSCYIIYSNEGGHYLHNIKLLKETVTKLDGKILLKDKASLLYMVD